MDKLLDFGKRAWFLVRVLSGYEERRIRSFRLQLQKRIEEARARKMELRRAPEQAILAEVRRMVEEMQTLNHRLDKTEAAIEDYFKPIDKKAEIIMNLQLEKEEKQLKEMIEVMQEQAVLQKPLQLNQSESVVVCPSNSQPPESTSQQEQIKYDFTNRQMLFLTDFRDPECPSPFSGWFCNKSQWCRLQFPLSRSKHFGASLIRASLLGHFLSRADKIC